ncbi:hypothetical protein [Desulfobulbus elongatus]|uniref:hypothetical protein n=1 Tax=Desulfobulbus elongatus TaxID=53332 RepID=UPI00048014F8|nr:hypothetical protein [Desulfobulbus elongatus]
MMAKKMLTCEVLATIKGLDPKDPQGYTRAGTTERPVLVELADSADTQALIAAGAVRIWPGPQEKPAAPAAGPDLKSLRKIEDVLTRFVDRCRGELESAVDADKGALQTALDGAESDLSLVRELMK